MNVTSFCKSLLIYRFCKKINHRHDKINSIDIHLINQVPTHYSENSQSLLILVFNFKWSRRSILDQNLRYYCFVFAIFDKYSNIDDIIIVRFTSMQLYNIINTTSIQVGFRRESYVLMRW